MIAITSPQAKEMSVSGIVTFISASNIGSVEVETSSIMRFILSASKICPDYSVTSLPKYFTEISFSLPSARSSSRALFICSKSPSLPFCTAAAV